VSLHSDRELLGEPRAIDRILVTRGTIAMGLRVGGVAVAYLSNVLLSRLLGLHGYGLYAILIGWVSLLSVQARLGFDATALRYVTIYREEGAWNALRGLITVATGTVASIAVAFSALMMVIGSRLEVDGENLAWASALIVPTSLLGLFSAFMLSARKVFYSQFFDQILRPAVLISLLCGAYLVGGADLAGRSAMMLTTAAALAALLVLSGRFLLAFRRSFGVEPDYGSAPAWFRLSLPLFLITAVQELLNQLQVVMLGGLMNAQAAGLFAAASRLSNLLSFGLVAVSSICGPMIASAYHRRALGELGRLASLTAKIGLAFAIVAAIGLVVAGPLLLSLFGGEFTAAYPVLVVLIAGGLVNAFTGVVAYLLTLTGHEVQALVTFALALAANIILNLLLIPHWGPVGAAAASTSSTILWNVAMVVYVRRRLGIDASALGFEPRHRSSA
jgi:O-antigen/teichoic acid export membrane protein